MPGWYLHDITLDTALELLGVDDQPAIMRHSEFARPDFAGVTVNLDLGDDRNHRTRALPIGDAAPGQHIAIAVGIRRGPRLPLGALGRRFDHGDVALRLQIAQAECDRV